MPKDNANYLKLLDKLSDIHLDIGIVKTDIKYIREDVDKNTKDLEEHKMNSLTNTKRLEMEIDDRIALSERVLNVDDRVSQLEIPKKALKYLRNAILMIGGVAGAFYGIYRLSNIIF